MKRGGNKGFTIVEIMVVVALIGILVGATMRMVGAELAVARDTRRKADLKKLQTALGVYYAKYGSYPSTGGSYYFSEPNCGGAYTDNGGNWIPGLAPRYIPKLPRDPNGGPSSQPAPCDSYCKSYFYTSDGKDYKLMAHCSPEGPLLATDPFYDPQRPTSAWMVCSGDPACSAW